ncbi:hypothetical protein TBLA_0I00200 [Henningerozyma blattae CBS 6284]|uniref:Ribosomal protein S6 n=1 Tax=Henningerozyma blattae (strain ATCC 34711 / CBS 6284 / DSM 70876 / NBRC 10599 / NRRL Y-10934 / UCD 77-7) TaxID=1071380 RepID=I2H8I3_HENB6|nr:hypothetical protein TBLA_0I00200 [Tetrapisispora blattae CBS 6284]CCH62685.1 hypothetical protein TBLA_0I00200 [Tetrapisispora blattae CBS 6284]
MLYELLTISRITHPSALNQEAKEIAKMVGKLVIENRGVVRNVFPLGYRNLPKIIKKDQEKHFRGFNTLMLFDASPAVQSQIHRIIKKDPRIIRSSIISVSTKKSLDVATSYEKAYGKKTILERNSEYL